MNTSLEVRSYLFGGISFSIITWKSVHTTHSRSFVSLIFAVITALLPLYHPVGIELVLPFSDFSIFLLTIFVIFIIIRP